MTWTWTFAQHLERWSDEGYCDVGVQQTRRMRSAGADESMKYAAKSSAVSSASARAAWCSRTAVSTCTRGTRTAESVLSRLLPHGSGCAASTSRARSSPVASDAGKLAGRVTTCVAKARVVLLSLRLVCEVAIRSWMAPQSKVHWFSRGHSLCDRVLQRSTRGTVSKFSKS